MTTVSDIELVQAALTGDEAACAQIRSADNVRYLEGLLVKRGAAPTEAVDLVADLFADCFGAKIGKTALLRKFNGKGALRAFLSRTAVNRLIDLKRHQKFEGELPSSPSDTPPVDEFDQLEGDSLSEDKDDSLNELLRDALSVAMTECDPLSLLLLRLVSVHGINQAKAGEMLGWSQSKVSRNLTEAMEVIRDVTMREVQQADPWLELEWDDFLGLCRSSSDFILG